MFDLADTLDLERYPLEKAGAPRARALLERCCRAEVAARGFAQLPAFLRPGALKSAVAEALSCGEGAYHMFRMFSYGEGMPEAADPESLAPDDPRRYPIRTRLTFVPSDEIPQNSPLKAAYGCLAMGDFIAGVFGHDRLHRASDPLNGFNYLIYREGDEQDWHFDEHDFSVTLLLQSAEEGGFEFVPGLKSASGREKRISKAC